METHLMIDRYLQGILDEGDTAAFEERLVWDSVLIDEIDLAEHLRDALRDSVADGSHNFGVRRRGFIGQVSDVLAVPQFAAAASFAFAVALTVGVLNSPLMPDASDMEFDLSPMPTEIIPLLVVRGVSAQPVTFRTDTRNILLVEAVGNFASYRVTVRPDEPGAEPIWTQDGLSITYPDSIAVDIPWQLLAAGPHTLMVEGMSVSDSGEPTFEFVQNVSFDATIEE